MKNIFLALISLVFVGCAYSVHEVHTSDFTPYHANQEGHIVSAQAQQFVIMGFVGDTDYVNQAYQELLSQCPGTISGITTEYYTALGFFSWTNKILMQGLCFKGHQASR